MVKKSKKNIRNIMKKVIKEDLLGVLIANFAAIDRKEMTLNLQCDIHSYENVYYQEFVHLERYNLHRMFSFINTIKILEYGYTQPDSEELLRDYNGTSMRLGINNINQYKGEIEFKQIIKGEPFDIDMLSQQGKFKIVMEVTGSLHIEKQFWQESLYNMYHLYQIGNFAGAFMNAFIAFEGYLRSIAQDYKSDVWEVYEMVVGEKFTKDLIYYNKLRNQLMHGNENNAKWMDEEEIFDLLSYFLEAHYKIKHLKN